MSEFANKTGHAFLGLSINLVVQTAIVFTMVALVLYSILFSEYPAVHDYFHHLRHSLSIIPCH
jgi:hypothetical protein